MMKTFGRRAAAGLAGMALAASGLAVFGSTGSAGAQPNPGQMTFEPNPVSPEPGSKFVATLPVTVEREPLTDDFTLKIDKQEGVDCTPNESAVPRGTESGSYSLKLECTINGQSDNVLVNYTVSYGDRSEPGQFGFDLDPQPAPTGTPQPTESAPPTASPSETASPTASPSPTVVAPAITVHQGTFDPPRAVVKRGTSFKFSKSLTISDAPLTADVTMRLHDYKGITCEPESDSLKAGTQPGTHEFVFTCTFTGEGGRAQAKYTISGDDLPEPVSSVFGYGDLDTNGSPGKPSKPGGGGLADTGAPALGVVLAGGLTAAMAGGLLLRRRK